MQSTRNITTLLSVGESRDSRSGSIVMEELEDELVDPFVYRRMLRLRVGLPLSSSMVE